MIIGVRIPINPDIMGDKSSPVSGLIIMKKPNALTRDQVYSFVDKRKAMQGGGGEEE